MKSIILLAVLLYPIAIAHSGDAKHFKFKWSLTVTYSDNEQKNFMVMPEGGDIPLRGTRWKCRYLGVEHSKGSETIMVQCYCGKAFVVDGAFCFTAKNPEYVHSHAVLLALGEEGKTKSKNQVKLECSGWK